MQKIITSLWYDKEAKEAAEFYTKLFDRDSKILKTSVIENTPSGSVDVVSFSLWGYEFNAISAGPYFKFTPAISISVQCHTEEEVNRLYSALADGGTTLMPLDTYPWSAKYAWVGDRYGLTWQLNLPNHQEEITQRIAPFLMYVGTAAGKAEEAMTLYTSVFPDSSINVFARYGAEDAPDKEGTIKHAEFKLFGEQLMAMDSAHEHKFTFNEAVSLTVNCDSQEEIDRYWEKLSAFPESEQCGWIKDKYGVSWQIVPKILDELTTDPDKEKAARATQAMLQMKKLDIAKLKAAYDG